MALHSYYRAMHGILFLNINMNIKNRIIAQCWLLGKLPTQGRLVEMALVESIMEKIRFTAKEIEEYELKDNENGTVWNPDKTKGHKIEFTTVETELLKKTVDRLDEAGEIEQLSVGLCKYILEL